MGREKSAHWAARRASWSRHEQQPRTFPPRVYTFAARVEIAGVTGPACVEPIERPLKGCPAATVRIIVRWDGKLAKGARISTGDRELVVLRVFPMTDRVRVAHLLCARADAQLVAAPEEDALP
jgi:hypothetical protein